MNITGVLVSVVVIGLTIAAIALTGKKEGKAK